MQYIEFKHKIVWFLSFPRIESIRSLNDAIISLKRVGDNWPNSGKKVIRAKRNRILVGFLPNWLQRVKTPGTILESVTKFTHIVILIKEEYTNPFSHPSRIFISRNCECYEHLGLKNGKQYGKSFTRTEQSAKSKIFDSKHKSIGACKKNNPYQYRFL